MTQLTAQTRQLLQRFERHAKDSPPDYHKKGVQHFMPALMVYSKYAMAACYVSLRWVHVTPGRY